MSKVAVALDLGGTQLRAAAIDPKGSVIRREAIATRAQDGPSIVVGQMVDIAQRMISACNGYEVVGIGVCSPGPLDSVAGVVVSISTIKDFLNVPIVALLKEKLRHKVLLENDAVAAACGEWKFGAGRGVNDIAFITVSTGLGGGLICDGKVLRGVRGFAGHVGHMTIVANGVRCTCGNPGCWESYGSGTAFTQRARQRLGISVDAAQVFRLASQGNSVAQELVDEEADYLGIGIINLLHLFSPARVIMGGGMANGFDQLHPGIARRILHDAIPAFRSVEICKAELMDNAGLFGVAQLVFDDA